MAQHNLPDYFGILREYDPGSPQWKSTCKSVDASLRVWYDAVMATPDKKDNEAYNFAREEYLAYVLSANPPSTVRLKPHQFKKDK